MMLGNGWYAQMRTDAKEGPYADPSWEYQVKYRQMTHSLFNVGEELFLWFDEENIQIVSVFAQPELFLVFFGAKLSFDIGSQN